MADELIQLNLWINGPELLSHSNSEPSMTEADIEKVSQEEGCPTVTTALSMTPAKEKVIEVSRWGTLQKSLRVIAWLQRFAYNMKRVNDECQLGELTFSELAQSKYKLFQ